MRFFRRYASGVLILTLFVVGLVGGFFLFEMWLDGPSGQDTLQQRANLACGADKTVQVIFHPSGFARRESFETRCLRVDGTPYTVVTQ